MSIHPNESGRFKLFARIPWWVALVAVIAIAARLIPGPRTIDDAFITFRYARHILAGDGFTFNPGEHVLGTTTPLYTLLMAFLGLFSGGAAAPFPLLALGVNALADALTCILLWQIGKRLGHELAGAVTAAVWAVAPFSVTFAIGGMETSVYILLSTAAILAFLREKYPLTFFLCGLAFLTRPDALIFIGLLALGRAWVALKSKAFAPLLKDAAAFLAPVVPWLIFAGVYFGSFIPHSIAAKSLAYRLGADEGFVRLIQHYTTPFYDTSLIGMTAVGIGLVLYPFLTLVGFRSLQRQDRRVWAVLAYPWLYFVVYAVANPLIFRWYLTPPLPVYFLGILAGAQTILNGIGRWLGRRAFFAGGGKAREIACRAPLILLALPIISSLGGWVLHPDHGLTTPAPEMAFYKLELLYSQTAERIQPMLQPGDLLAAGDVGVLGYTTEAQILDTVGLNSPLSSQYFPLPAEDYVINYAIPTRLILDARPRFVIFPEVYGRNTLLKSQEFLSQYTRLDTLETDIYGSRGLLIYVRSG